MGGAAGEGTTTIVSRCRFAWLRTIRSPAQTAALGSKDFVQTAAQSATKDLCAVSRRSGAHCALFSERDLDQGSANRDIHAQPTLTWTPPPSITPLPSNTPRPTATPPPTRTLLPTLESGPSATGRPARPARRRPWRLCPPPTLRAHVTATHHADAAAGPYSAAPQGLAVAVCGLQAWRWCWVRFLSCAARSSDCGYTCAPLPSTPTEKPPETADKTEP